MRRTGCPIACADSGDSPIARSHQPGARSMKEPRDRHAQCGREVDPRDDSRTAQFRGTGRQRARGYRGLPGCGDGPCAGSCLSVYPVPANAANPPPNRLSASPVAYWIGRIARSRVHRIRRRAPRRPRSRQRTPGSRCGYETRWHRPPAAPTQHHALGAEVDHAGASLTSKPSAASASTVPAFTDD